MLSWTESAKSWHAVSSAVIADIMQALVFAQFLAPCVIPGMALHSVKCQSVSVCARLPNHPACQVNVTVLNSEAAMLSHRLRCSQFNGGLVNVVVVLRCMF